jgi:uncharacterized protein (TIGR04255 family)
MFEETDTGHRHAIREAVFAIVFSEALPPTSVQKAVQELRESWKPELPKIQEFQLAPAAMPLGPGLPNVSLSFGAAAAFEAYKVDGSLSWRVLIQGNLAAVNCLDYNGWLHVWPRARRYLSELLPLLVSARCAVAGCQLQYINAFHWRNALQDYDLTLLLRDDTDRVPPRLLSEVKGPLWHFHQGWFDAADEMAHGRVLSREHLTGQEEVERGATVLIDLSKRHDFSAQFGEADALFGPEGVGEQIFSKLRFAIRSSLRAYLRDDILDRIGAFDLR